MGFPLLRKGFPLLRKGGDGFPLLRKGFPLLRKGGAVGLPLLHKGLHVYLELRQSFRRLRLYLPPNGVTEKIYHPESRSSRGEGGSRACDHPTDRAKKFESLQHVRLFFERHSMRVSTNAKPNARLI